MLEGTFGALDLIQFNSLYFPQNSKLTRLIYIHTSLNVMYNNNNQLARKEDIDTAINTAVKQLKHKIIKKLEQRPDQLEGSLKVNQGRCCTRPCTNCLKSFG